MESVSKASFGLSETFRIVLPGYYLLAIGYGYLIVLDPEIWQKDIPDALLVLLGLVLGFILYSINYPNTRPAYTKDLPSKELLSLSIQLKKPLENEEHIRLYFYILNNFFSQTFHEVVMVRGALYYCVTYFWRCSEILSLVGVFTLVLISITRMACGEIKYSLCGFIISSDDRTFCRLFLYTLLHALIWFFLTHPNRTDRMFSVICKDQIEWLKLNKSNC